MSILSGQLIYIVERTLRRKRKRQFASDLIGLVLKSELINSKIRWIATYLPKWPGMGASEGT